MKQRRMTIQCFALGLGAIALTAACGDEVESSGDSSSQSSSNSSSGISSSGSGSSSSGSGGAGGEGAGGAGGGAGGSSAGGGGSGGGIECDPGPVEAGARVDILFDIDNSRSMADKQGFLSLVVADLVGSLSNPPCVDANGASVPDQPPAGFCACPAGASRSRVPVTDMHIGVISSSIGGHGADVCPNIDNNSCQNGTPSTSNNDKGHLLSRKDPCSPQSVPTYENKGFLAWDPSGQQQPPGETSEAVLATTFKDLVLGAGQIGCGYESQLESWYRFLVDPEPYETISVVNNSAVPTGTDQVLLAQRADFLRPDSLLAVFMLTDENDCSTKEYGQFFLANQIKNGNSTVFHLPRPRAECATSPNDPCCKSCAQAQGACPADPTCTTANGSIKALTDQEDSVNLRCFDQKRRFGIDFLYPVERYIGGLTSATIPNRQGDLVPNPVYSDLNPNDPITTIRGSERVFLTGIVGVPWQDVARDHTDLTQGLKDATELAAVNGSGQSGWDTILGIPAQYVLPADPHMIESSSPRSGTNPITGDAIAPVGSPNGMNPINGHEYTIASRDDLQYACIVKLTTPRNCADPSNVSCDCRDPNNDSPLCDVDPSTGQRTLQVSAKAYPGLRELSVLKGIEQQGVVASICPAQIANPSSADFAYLPAVNAFIERVTPLLAPSP